MGGNGMGNGPAVSGKKVADLFLKVKHGRGPDRAKRKSRNTVQSLLGKPSGKTWEGRDV